MNRASVVFMLGCSLVISSCGSEPHEEISEATGEDVLARQHVRVLDPSGRELQYAETAFLVALDGHCDRRLTDQPAGANACGVTPVTSCSEKLCEAEHDLCVANTLLEIRGLHGELRLDLPDPAPPDGGMAALVAYSIPQQSTGTDALLARRALDRAVQALYAADSGLRRVANGACSAGAAEATYSGGSLTMQGGLALAFVESYQVAQDAVDATSADFIAAAESSSPIIWDGAETDDAWERTMPTMVSVGPTFKPVPGDVASSLCASEMPAGGGAVALDLFRRAGLPPDDIAGAVATDTLVMGNDPTSLRNQLASLWARPEMSTTASDPLTSAELYGVFGATPADFEEARAYLRAELIAFDRDTTVTVLQSPESMLPPRFAAVASEAVPLPFTYYSLFAREQLEHSFESHEPRTAWVTGFDLWGWSGVVDFAAKRTAALLSGAPLTALPAAALADPHVDRALAGFLSQLQEDYVGHVEIFRGGDASKTLIQLYLPAQTAELDDFVIVNSSSALSCLVRGDVEGVRCEWPSASAHNPVSQTLDTSAPNLPVLLTFPELPASEWTRVHLLRLRTAGIRGVPGQYEPVIGFPGLATWPVPSSGASFPIARSAERAAADAFAPSSASCNHPRLSCTGLREDGPIALEDDLNADGDPHESSWRHYLDLARQAAAEADLLGEQVLEAGEAIDQRAELAAQALAQICGSEVDIDPLADIPTAELRSSTTCPDGTGCPTGYVCQSGACVRDPVDLLSQRPEPGFHRLAECIGASSVVPFVALGDQNLCLWHDIGDPTTLCSGAGSSHPCPHIPYPVPDGSEPTLDRRCPVPDPSTQQAVLIGDDALLGFFRPSVEGVQPGGAPPCAAIRRLRAATTAADRARYVDAVADSNFFAAPTPLHAIGAGVSWRAEPGDFSTLAFGRQRVSTGDHLSGPNMAWPCADRTGALPDGCEPTTPTSGDAGTGLFCERVSDCTDVQARAYYNHRLARAAVLARQLTGNGLAGFRTPWLPRDMEWTPYCGVGMDDARYLDYRGALVSSGDAGALNQWTRDGESARIYSHQDGPFQPLWHVEAGGLLLPAGNAACSTVVFLDRTEGSDSALWRHSDAVHNWRTRVEELWREDLPSRLAVIAANPAHETDLDLVPAPDLTAFWGAADGPCVANPASCLPCFEQRTLTSSEIVECFELLSDHEFSGPSATGDERYQDDLTAFYRSAAGNNAYIGRALDGIRFENRDVLDAMELICEAGGTRAAGCDVSRPPVIRNPEDLPVANAYMSCLASAIERRAAMTVFAAMPARAMDALREESGIGSFPAVGGEYGANLSRLRGALVELGSVPGMIAAEIRQMGNDVELAQGALEMSSLTRDRAQIEFLSNMTGQIAACANSVAGILTNDFTAAIGRTFQAAITCGNSIAQIIFAQDLRANTGAMADVSDDATVLELRGMFGTRAEALRSLSTRLATAIEEVDASLAQMESLRQAANLELGRGMLLSTEGAGAAYHVNTFMRARYDARRVRYERARERALSLAFLAKRAIEQRLGVRLSSLREDLGVIDAPANWEGDLCTMDAIDYRRLRDSSGLARGTLDASIALSNGYVGDYVDRLELVFSAYANRYPFTSGDATTVFSVRDDIHHVRAQCAPDEPGVNLLYQTEAMAALGLGGNGGWEATGCTPGEDGVCVAVAQLDEIASVEVDPLGLGQIRPFRVTFGPLTDATCTAGVCTPSCTTGPCACAPPSCLTTADTEWRQRITIPRGRYRLSWYGRPVGAPSSVSAENAVALPSGGLEGDVVQGGIETRAASAGWTRFWRLVEVRSESAVMGVSIAPFDAAGTVQRVGAVDVAGMMLEDVSHAFRSPIEARTAPEPPPFVGTRASRASTLPACEDTDGRAFRAQGWRRGCERLCPDGFGRGCARDPSTEHCYWETQFTISQQTIERSTFFQNGSLAIGNFNYRIDGIALNLVGTGVRSCATSPTPSSCYGTGVVPFSLRHVGPHRVRNHWGQTYDAPLFTSRIEHGQALAAERYLTVPLSSADRSLVDSVTHHEFRGRPLDGTYVLRIWESNGVDFEQIEDVQVMLS